MAFEMFALLSLAPLNQPAPAPDQIETENEIVVIGERLKKWSGKYKIRGEKMRCSTKQSSGDREIDAIGCAAFETCATNLMPRIAASDSKDLDKNVREAMKTSVKQDLSTCVSDRRKHLIADLANKRT